MNPSPADPSKLAIIFAGEDVPATLRDGARHLVRVRSMPARHLGRVLALLDKEAELLDFVCFLPRDKEEAGFDPVPANFVDNLTPESHVALYETAKKLNFSEAVAWAERQITAKRVTGELGAKMEEVISPVMERLLEPMTDRLMSLLASLSKLPTSGPASPSTKS